ncbi:MAG: endonuclease domain-containing protein [Prevotellaceae bacterium]|nr:endonuclease domain-containing protein [Prevotellaceae bacterium]
MAYNGRMTYASPDRYGLLKEYARKNRNNMTLGEKALWSSLRHKFLGHRFYRQYIIADYIVDFLCHEGGVIIEVDGGYHSEPRQTEDDKLRTQRLEQLGFHVLRFSNEEILADIEDVEDRILEFLEQ